MGADLSMDDGNISLPM